MDLSIIIINYNALKMTDNCISSIVRNTKGITYEIIVIDNASTDGSKEKFQNDDRILYHYNEENIGFGRANNIGVSISGGRNIVFLNNDTLLTGNSLCALCDLLDSNETIGACGANLVSVEGKSNYSYGSYFPGLFSEFNRLFRNVPVRLAFPNNEYFNTTGIIRDVAFISGADLMVRKSVLDKVGCFNPSFFLYYEETELCFRIRKYGFRIVNVPSERIIHFEGASISPNVVARKWSDDMMHESCEIFMSLTRSEVYRKMWYALHNFTAWSKMAFDRKRAAKKGMVTFSVFPRTSVFSNTFSEALAERINKIENYVVINHPSMYSSKNCSKKWYWGDTVIFCTEEGRSVELPEFQVINRLKKAGHRVLFVSNKEVLAQVENEFAQMCDSMTIGADVNLVINNLI